MPRALVGDRKPRICICIMVTWRRIPTVYILGDKSTGCLRRRIYFDRRQARNIIKSTRHLEEQVHTSTAARRQLGQCEGKHERS